MRSRFFVSRLDRQLLHGNAQVHDGGKLRGDPTDPDRLNSVSVDMARHFHDTFIGQILDQAVVWDIAVYQRRVAGYRGMNDAGRVFIAAAHLDRLAAFQFLAQGMPLFDLHLAAPDVFVKGILS